MLNSYDLMLGNWVQSTSGGITEVYYLKRRIKSGLLLVNGKPIDYFAPIPLTPELMQQIGWEMYESQWGIETTIARGIKLVIADHDNIFLAPGIAKENVKYLHELQNLYRWATGKQLEISLTYDRR